MLIYRILICLFYFMIFGCSSSAKNDFWNAIEGQDVVKVKEILQKSGKLIFSKNAKGYFAYQTNILNLDSNLVVFFRDVYIRELNILITELINDNYAEIDEQLQNITDIQSDNFKSYQEVTTQILSQMSQKLKVSDDLMSLQSDLFMNYQNTFESVSQKKQILYNSILNYLKDADYVSDLTVGKVGVDIKHILNQRQK